MRTIDMFASVLGQAVQDGHIQKYGAILLRQGVKGVGKANPVVVWAEAVVAVIEAGGAYCRYCAATEVTEQIRLYNQTLETLLSQELQIGELQIKELCKEKKNRQAHIERTLVESRAKAQFTQKEVRTQLKLLMDFQRFLHEQRLQSGSFRQLIELQVVLDKCIDDTLSLMFDLE